MVIKSYVAPSVAGALKMIRAELGSKAVVLKTRGLSARESGAGRRMVEITACLEKPTVGALSASLADSHSQPQSLSEMSPPTLEKDRDKMLSAIGAEELYTTAGESVASSARIDKQSENIPSAGDETVDSLAKERTGMEEITAGSTRAGMVDIRDVESFAKRLEEKLDLILDTHLSAETIGEVAPEVAPVARMLAAQDIPERLLRPLLKRIGEKVTAGSAERPLACAEEVLVAEFAAISRPDLSLRAGDVALFVGPAGSGKTSVLGKVAVNLLFKKRIKTELSTLDDFRIAAREEITSYGEALGAACVDPDNLASTLNQTDLAAQRTLLVDCHSNINDQRQFMRLRERAAALQPTAVFLVVSALTRSADVARLIRRFERFNPTHIIATHTDLTDTIGGIYTAALDSGLKLCALTNSPGSLGELLSPDPGKMARRVLERSK